MILYTIGDATDPEGIGSKVIAHVCNDVGGWGRGFVRSLSKRWPEPEEAYRAWHAGTKGEPFELGRVQFVPVGAELWVANMVGQHGIRGRRRPAGAPPPVRYEAIDAALQRVASFATARGASVHMPRIGCGLAGGNWERVEAIIKARLVAAGVAVVVYDVAGEERP